LDFNERNPECRFLGVGKQFPKTLTNFKNIFCLKIECF